MTVTGSEIPILSVLITKYFSTSNVIKALISNLKSCLLKKFQDLKEVGRQIKAYWCIKTAQSLVHSLLFETYMFFILFVVPLTIMGISYSRISHEIWNVSSRRASLSARRLVCTARVELVQNLMTYASVNKVKLFYLERFIIN